MATDDADSTHILEADISDYGSLKAAGDSQSTFDLTFTPSRRGSPLHTATLANFPPPVSDVQIRPRATSNALASPSSPDLRQHARVNDLTRSHSHTLPRLPHAPQPPQSTRSEFHGLHIDQQSAEMMRRWVTGIAIVDFDLDQGPVISTLFPPLQLHPVETENIAFSSFPDSIQFDQGSQIHSFRVREQISQARPQPYSIDGFIYGFSHFTQRRDVTSRRGYQQRSLVILTQHQYPALFCSLASILGPLFLSHGVPMLESACHNISGWPNPVPNITVELGFLGSVLNVELPSSLDDQQLTETSSFNEKYDPKSHILAGAPSFFPPPLLLFEACLPHLWSIWECLILCEPILIFGQSPAQTSQAVWWFRDLLRPIPLAGDIRPYFTLQDADHQLLVNKLPPKQGVLLGVTNPFFEKSCGHWPHILSLGRRAQNGSGSRFKAANRPAGPSPGWKTKTHSRYISKDRNLLRELEVSLQGDDLKKLNTSLKLRQHFCSRTTALLFPLSRYLHTLIPSPAAVAAARSFGKNPELKPFSSADFLISLKTNGTTLPFRSSSKRMEFYERWLKTPFFGLWLAQQEGIVERVLMENRM